MSTASGGEVVLDGAAAGAVDGSLATFCAGGIVVGAGYLVYRRGYRTVKACKKCWSNPVFDSHYGHKN